MKKIFVLFSFLVVTAATAQAQISLGLKAGISSSSVDIKNASSNTAQFKEDDNITGFHAGAFARIQYMGFHVQPEAVFSASGGKVEIQEAVSGDKTVEEIGFSHLDVPVLFGYTFLKVARVYAGPVASILINSDFGDEKVDKYFDSADWGFQVGAGLDISRLSADVRYERLSRSYADDASNKFDVAGQQIILSLGYKFIGK
ncbi:outer membrane beta-barrel protein [Nibribacter ruber]|uniref:Outer membrane beta-barrel protein n=1 Tax=Nibribacter ruber TaxID=2698458 RepID=A0A6P1NZR1_9BACT|nr:porin family protein [Nibribacter ruber]QHL86082.1 outer membrane beta-barrel protein [Nibribacter ruber]